MMKYRSTLLGLLTAIFMLLLITPANSQQGVFSISELHKQVKDGWHQTYEAYGRTIEVDLDIEVPKVNMAPVLLVKRRPTFVDPLSSQLAKNYKAPVNDPKLYYAFESDAIASSTAYAYNYPFGLDEDSRLLKCDYFRRR